MWSFLSEFIRNSDGAFRIIVMDEEAREQPRHHHVRPRRILLMVGATALLVALAMVALIVLTPLRELIPGYGTAALRRDARLASVRLEAMQDSLAAQQQYVDHLRNLLIGQVGGEVPSRATASPAVAVPDVDVGAGAEPSSENWSDHAQPALSLERLPVETASLPAPPSTDSYVGTLYFPALPPVSGFMTAPFDPHTGHYAIDLAVEEGTLVRAIGDGYVFFGDWTHEGGYVVAVQHSEGFVTVYKHNNRLLKRVGDRVRAREAIAVSGNTGEQTTGPHLHFELWHNGLAQDPRSYLVGF